MSTTPEKTVSQIDDAYILRPEDVKEPPEGFMASLKYLGPGLITSASIVGSGELIATTTLGAKAGYALLWLVIISTLVKVAVQIEVARYTIATGKPALTGFNEMQPRIGRLGWISILWITLAIAKIVQLGGIVGGTAVAMSIMMPFGGDPLGKFSVGIWCAILVVAAIAGLWTNRYGLIEGLATALVVTFSIITILLALGLPFTPFGYSGADLASGLLFTIPAGALGAAVAMFGITGVGADEILFYTYWCVEKGYARWAGPNDGSDEWARRANGWIKVMQRDAMVSWVIYTFSTAAFYLMGAAVLSKAGEVPKGNGVITTLSKMYTQTLGDWANIMFLIAAVAVLGSTMLAAIPSHSRMWVNFFANAGLLDWHNPAQREKWLKFFVVALPVAWGLLYIFVSAPVLMVQIGGIVTGIFLLAVLAGCWFLKKTAIDQRIASSTAFTVGLAVSSIAIAALGIYSVFDALGYKIA